MTKIRGKAGQQRATWPFFNQCVCEDEDHLFWVCPTHEDVRKELREKYTNWKSYHA